MIFTYQYITFSVLPFAYWFILFSCTITVQYIVTLRKNIFKNKLTKLGRCDRTAELQTAELFKLLLLLEE